MRRVPRPAQYLLRIDDLCPTVNARRWGRIRKLICEFSIRPILAVIPDNQDKSLKVSAPDPGFWDQMRELEAEGATVALHGYCHWCTGTGRSLIPVHRRTEFAGVSRDVQQEWIADGLRILREKELTPKLWVAPRHSFDRNTLYALRKEGIRYLSDGLARIPFRRGGITWIPQQLWSPAPRSSGLFTICVHPNTTRHRKFDELREFITEYAEDFTHFDRVVEEFDSDHLGPIERAREVLATGRLRLHRWIGERSHASTE